MELPWVLDSEGYPIESQTYITQIKDSIPLLQGFLNRFESDKNQCQGSIGRIGAMSADEISGEWLSKTLSICP